MIDLQGTATAGVVVILAVLIALVIEPARGHNGNPYTWLGALPISPTRSQSRSMRWRS